VFPARYRFGLVAIFGVNQTSRPAFVETQHLTRQTVVLVIAIKGLCVQFLDLAERLTVRFETARLPEGPTNIDTTLATAFTTHP
jgi:hypothetical protein